MKFPCQVILFVLFNLFLPVNETFGQIASGEAVYFNSTAIKGWAVKCIVRRGYVNISDKSAGRASAGDDVSCLGRADNITVSLGDSGYAVVGFSEPVFDIEGDDFAVFENSFDGRFLEFAFVEASTDSIRWVRFPARSLIQTDVQTGAFGLSDPQLIHNLAGKYPAYYGTPFDLAVLRDSSGIDINNVNFIKIVDCIGSVNHAYASYDSYGTRINDPWPTPFPQSGFDLDAVAVLKTPSSDREEESGHGFEVFPNPASTRLFINSSDNARKTITLSGITGSVIGRWVLNSVRDELDIQGIAPGIYFLSITCNNKKYFTRLIIY
ncbi:MAG TPA: T9SS type A sorting domain-containing protein [Bacteroidales bacterium]|nr:T9SS type A sorting domain-containing protein [Bacteroidales bacterium]